MKVRRSVLAVVVAGLAAIAATAGPASASPGTHAAHSPAPSTIHCC